LYVDIIDTNNPMDFTISNIAKIVFRNLDCKIKHYFGMFVEEVF